MSERVTERVSERRIVVIASRNADKLRELRELCEGLPFEVRSAGDYEGLPEIIEDGTTILGNATRKALATAAFTGEIAVADDTSLSVQALNGLPDVFAARFAGPDCSYDDNCRLLSELMRDVPDDQRDAWFETAAVWIDPRPADGRTAAAAPGVATRWLHDPYRRTIHLADPLEEEAFWNELMDRRAVWDEYVARMSEPGATAGVDTARLAHVLEDLTTPVRHGGRPGDAAPGDLRLPDPRIWTADGPDDAVPPTRFAPTGMPAGSRGHAINAPVWRELSCRGKVLGEIVRAPRGMRGFGYDPVFRPCGSDRTLAEMGAEEKNALSHRGRAMRRLLGGVAAIYDG